MSTFAENSLSDESLQRELQNKDNIILALTEQLENTVDQLDRLKRSGVKENSGDSRSQSPFGLASQVASALEAYDELAPAEHFDRIEDGIDQILQLLSQGSVQLAALPEAAEKNGESEAKDDSFWEETKSRLMGGDSSPATLESAATQDSLPTQAESDEEFQSESTPVQEPFSVPAMPEAPKPIEDLKDIVTLEEGVGSRDDYIVYLVARLRSSEQAKIPVINWDDLEHAPEKLVQELLDLKIKLEDHLRQSEISKLFQVKQYLAQEVKRLGEETQANATEGKGGNAESRWGKFFETKK